jgi:hypothetical protein
MANGSFLIPFLLCSSSALLMLFLSLLLLLLLFSLLDLSLIPIHTRSPPPLSSSSTAEAVTNAGPRLLPTVNAGLDTTLVHSSHPCCLTLS